MAVQAPMGVNELTVTTRDARVVRIVHIALIVASRATPREDKIAPCNN